MTHLRFGCRRCANDDLKGRYSMRYFERWPKERNRPATLYHIWIQRHAEAFYKVGITTTKIKTRFSGYTRAIAGLAAIGRNLNQIARVAHASGNVSSGIGAELRALLQALGGLRNHFTAVVKANIESGSGALAARS